MDHDPQTHVELNVFDQREVFENCTVEVLTNSMTGEVSVGWWPNDDPPIGMEDSE